MTTLVLKALSPAPCQLHGGVGDPLLPPLAWRHLGVLHPNPSDSASPVGTLLLWSPAPWFLQPLKLLLSISSHRLLPGQV